LQLCQISIPAAATAAAAICQLDASHQAALLLPHQRQLLHCRRACSLKLRKAQEASINICGSSNSCCGAVWRLLLLLPWNFLLVLFWSLLLLPLFWGLLLFCGLLQLLWPLLLLLLSRSLLLLQLLLFWDLLVSLVPCMCSTTTSSSSSGSTASNAWSFLLLVA
jgi:hypothetical protein